MTATAAARRSPTFERILYLAIVTGAAAALISRLWIGRNVPLWLDEVWTGMIASQPTWARFWREAWLDPNAPLYYVFMALWTEVAGTSNWALKAPSLLFVGLAAALPILWRPAGLSAPAILTWAAILFLWGPAAAFSLDARSYALLLLISVAQTIAFANLIEKPLPRRAWIWATLASLALLTHYYSLVISSVQGLAFLLIHRRDALRSWPATLAFVPSLGWMAYHLPRLLEYSRSGIAWYGQLGPGEIVGHAVYPVGGIWLAMGLAFGLAAVLATDGSRDGADEPAPWLRWAVLSGLVALCLMLIIGAARPAMTHRYLTPISPSILLGLIIAARAARRAHAGYLLIVLAFLVSALASTSAIPRHFAHSYEAESAWLMAARPVRLIWSWDRQSASVLEDDSLRQVGAFFFTRAGVPVATTVVRPRMGIDANPVFLRAAAGSSKTAILWLYHRGGGSSGASFEPAIDRVPGWQCRDRRLSNGAGVTACLRR